MASTTSRARSYTRSGDCFGSKAFAFRTPSAIFMYAPMRRPVLLRLVIGDIVDREAAPGDHKPFDRALGAEGSNPPPSSRESAANPTSSIMARARHPPARPHPL